MKERPILFSGPMVRAILEGRKTQTRRIVKPQPMSVRRAEACAVDGDVIIRIDGTLAKLRTSRGRDAGAAGIMNEYAYAPYGVPSDRLWVRETWGPCDGGFCYKADNEDAIPDGGKWKPSIHMPRWASRITLEVKRVRVERL
jgi:hypothetical protein